MDAIMLPPDALADALARVVADHRREADAHLATVRAEHRQVVSELKADLAEHKARLERRADQEIELLEKLVMDRLSELKDGADGSDGAPGKDGEPGRDGAPGEKGEDGAPGEKGDPGEPGPPGVAGSEGPPGQDGEKGADGRDGDHGLNGADGRDGIGLAGAFVDRDGDLALTLTDGTVKHLGRIVGQDGAPGQNGKDGRDGFGFEDLEFEYDGVRTLTVIGRANAHEKRWSFDLPIAMDCGVYKDGETYAKGDGVTWAGSWWIAQHDEPTGKPGTNGDWRLAVKKGRDGKDGHVGEKGDRGEKGEPYVKVTEK